LSTDFKPPMVISVSEVKGQQTWIDEKLPDLRTLERDLRSEATEEIPPADTHEKAIKVVAQHLGFIDPGTCSLVVDTPMGEVTILRSSLYHIVEKRQDARERYVKMALDTLIGPFEVWQVEFTDGSHRLAFIGAYASRRQMLVSVAFVGGHTLWNFMHTDAKSLNKHRHGKLLFKRYNIF
jgi:hypothetical protein